MTFPINVGIPSTNNDPADDQPLMQQNFSNINGYVQVDHTNPGAAVGAGYHKQSTYTTLPSKPYVTPFGNNGAAYSKLVAGVSQLFFENNNLLETQITFPNLPNNPGYSYLPGGILIQWFSQAVTTTTTTYNFPNNFPNNCFNIVGSLTNMTGSVSSSIISSTQFSSKSSINANAYFIAIGN